MRALATVLVLASLTGCALSPVDLQERGPRTKAESKQAPLLAAACMTRRAEGMTFGIGVRVNANIRPAMETGGQEVVVMGPTTDFGPVAFAKVLPAASGSAITIWTNPDHPLFGLDQLQRMAEGC
jgi:hypothetical protein